MTNEETNKIGNIESLTVGTQLGVKSENSPFAECFYFQDFYDEKAIKRFIKNVEKLIRTSKEYKTYIELLRTNCHELNHDNLLINITSGDVDLEFHHYPFSLYDIVDICMTQHIIDETNFTSFSLAKEVMELHYKHLIGLVPLTKTTHELAHAGAIFISKKQIFGDVDGFSKKYNKAISQEIKMKLKEITDKSNAGELSDPGGLL